MSARRVVLPCIAVLLAGCAPRPAEAPSFDAWADGFAEEWARTAPQMATRAQYFAGDEQDRLDRQLSLIGEWGALYGARTAQARAAQASRGLDELRRYPVESLTATQRLTASVLEWALDDLVRSAAFADHAFVFEQFGGLQLEYVNSLTQTHPIRRAGDIETYLAKLTAVAARIDEGIADARAADAAGIRPPRFILQRTIEQLDGLLKQTGRDNVFVTTLDTRVAALGPAIPAADRTRFVDLAEKTVTDSVLPAYGRIRTLLAEQLPKATDDAGVWRLPRGADFYAKTLETFTTTRLTADEIHAIGLREVARLEGEMDTILRQLGYTEGSVNARYQQLEAARQPKGASDPRPQILADYTKWVRDAEQRSAALFDLRPKAPVEVRREPAFSERTAAAHYTNPAPDGTQPGVFWVPLPGPTFGLLRMRSLSYHEAVPGHHFQLAVQQELTDLPRFRRLGIFGDPTAYVEGWALYAERLADENGWYDGDPHGRLGYLNSMLFRARRLVVDTGLHAKRWTRQQAIDYGLSAQEIERYIVWPGQACSYMIGQLRILELREQTRGRLGARFSVKDFHNVVLRTGSVPLDVLAREIERALP